MTENDENHDSRKFIHLKATILLFKEW